MDSPGHLGASSLETVPSLGIRNSRLATPSDMVPARPGIGKAHVAQSARNLHQLLASVIRVCGPVADVLVFQEVAELRAVELLPAY